MIGIVASTADSASEHVRDHLLDLGDFERVDGIGEARAAALLKEVVPESHKRS